MRCILSVSKSGDFSMKEDTVTFCPKCKKPVETSEYFTREGLSDWRVESVGIKITCSNCGYDGLPIRLSAEDYKKVIQTKK